MVKHIIWLVVHLIAFYWFPEYGPSVTLLSFVLLEIVLKVRGDKRYELIHFYYLGLVIVLLSNISLIYQYRSGIDLINFEYAQPLLFSLASFVLAIGTQFIGLGFDLLPSTRLPEIYLRFKLNLNLVNWIFYLAIIFALKDFWLSFSFPGSMQTIVDFYPSVGVFILARLAGKYQKAQLFYKAIIAMVAVTLNAFLFSYLRVEMLLPIIVFLIGYFFGAKSFKELINVKLLPVLLLIVIFYSFFEFFGNNRSQVGVGVDRISQLNFARSDDRILFDDEDTGLSAFGRSSNISQISAVCGLVVNNGYYQGVSLTPLLVAFIPRIVWPEKPTIALGVWFALEIGAAVETDDWFNNSINMTIPGQLFLDFGWIGLGIGGILTGVLLRLLWNATGFYKKRFNLLGTYFGVYLLLTAFLGLGADLQILITFLALYFLLLFSSFIFRGKDENSLRRSDLERE
jgi:hypothetical protein